MYMYIKRWLCFDFICIKFELIYNMYIEQTSALNIHSYTLPFWIYEWFPIWYRTRVIR